MQNLLIFWRKVLFLSLFYYKYGSSKIRRLGWACHIIRMEEERIPKKVLNGTFHNTRPVGRPRTRWTDVVQRDALQLLGVRGWRRRAESRDEWRHALREAKARKGL